MDVPVLQSQSATNDGWNVQIALTRSQLMKFGAAAGAAAMLGGRQAKSADAKHYRFGYDQPHTTAYGAGADIVAAKLADLS